MPVNSSSSWTSMPKIFVENNYRTFSIPCKKGYGWIRNTIISMIRYQISPVERKVAFCRIWFLAFWKLRFCIYLIQVNTTKYVISYTQKCFSLLQTLLLPKITHSKIRPKCLSSPENSTSYYGSSYTCI
jgi:hypothetical protein